MGAAAAKGQRQRSRLRLRDGVSASDWIRGFEQRFPEAGYRIVDAGDGNQVAAREQVVASA